MAPWRQVLPALVMHLSGLPAGMGLVFTSVVATNMVSEGVLNTEQRYVFVSIFLIAAAIGAPFGALFIDRIGRKPMSIVVSSVSVIGWVLIASTSAAVPLSLGRLLTGISFGFVAVTANVYVVEITTAKLRGMLGIIYHLMLTTGVLVDLLIGSILPWRYLALLGATLSAAVLLGTLMIPESPRWLLEKSRPEEAMTELLRLRGPHANIHAEYSDMEISAGSSTSFSISIGTLLHPRYAKPILLSNAISMMIGLSGRSLINSYLDVILSHTGWNENLSTPMMLLGVAHFMAAILSICAIALTGRRQVLLVSLLVIAFSCTILGSVNYFGHMLNNKAYKWLSWILLFLYVNAQDIGVGPVCSLVRSELLPTRIRAPAMSCAICLNFFTGFIMTQTYPYILDIIHDYGVFWMLAALSLICFLFIDLFLPETKDKSLEEIEMGFLEAD